MSDNIPDRIEIRSLSLDDRAELAYTCFMEYATKGMSVNKIAQKHNLSYPSAKKLIDEHSAFDRANKPDTKSAALASYRWIKNKAAEAIEHPEGLPAIVQAKSWEAYIQAQTREDKLEGHEVSTSDVQGAAETIADLMRRAHQSGDLDGISPSDHGKMDEDIIEVEDIENDKS